MPETRRHEITRLEGFSDAVFGFALTLLVVSLDVPSSVDALMEQMASFVGFALMFAMVCWIWYEHNKFIRQFGLQDAWTVFVNAVLLDAWNGHQAGKAHAALHAGASHAKR